MRKLLMLLLMLSQLVSSAQTIDVLIQNAFKHAFISQMAVSANDKYLVARASYGYPSNQPFKIYSLAEDRIKSIPKSTYHRQVQSFALHPNREIVAVLPSGDWVRPRIIDLDTDEILHELPKSSEGQLYFHPNGHYLTVVSRNDIKVYDWQKEQLLEVLENKDYDFSISRFFFHPTGKLMLFVVNKYHELSNHRKQSLIAWDLEKRSLHHLYQTDGGRVLSDVHFSRNGDRTVVIERDDRNSNGGSQRVVIWSGLDFTRFAEMPINNKISAVALSPDGNFFAASDSEGERLDVTDLTTMHTASYQTERYFPDAKFLSFTPDSKTILYFSYHIHSFSLATREFQPVYKPYDFSFAIAPIYTQRTGDCFFIDQRDAKSSSLLRLSLQHQEWAIPESPKPKEEEEVRLPRDTIDFLYLKDPASLSSTKIVKQPTSPCIHPPELNLDGIRLTHQIQHHFPDTENNFLTAWDIDMEKGRAVTFIQDRESSIYSGRSEMKLWDIATACATQIFDLKANMGDDYHAITSAEQLSFAGPNEIRVRDFSSEYALDIESGEIKKVWHKDWQTETDKKLIATANKGKLTATIREFSNLITIEGSIKRVLNQYHSGPFGDIELYHPVFCLQDQVLAVLYREQFAHAAKGVIFFDPASGEELANTKFETEDILDYQFHEESNRLITVHQNGLLNFWDITELLNKMRTPDHHQEKLIVQTGHLGMISAVTFSPNGEELISSGEDNKIIRWDLKTGLHHQAISVNQAQQLLDFTPRSHRFFSLDTELSTWDFTTGTREKTADSFMTGNSYYHRRSDRLFKIVEAELEIWSLEEFKKKRVFSLPEKGGYLAKILDVSGDGRAILIDIRNNSNESTVFLFDSHSFRLIQKFSGFATAIDQGGLSENGQHLALVEVGGKINFIPVKQPHLRTSLSTGNLGDQAGFNAAGKYDLAYYIDFNSARGDRALASAVQGDKLITAGSFGNIAIWDIPNGKLIGTLHHHDPPPAWFVNNPSYNPHYNPISTLRISPDGNHLASVSERKTIRIWNLEDLKLVRKLDTRLSVPDQLVAHPREDIFFLTNTNEMEIKGFGSVNLSGVQIDVDTTIKICRLNNGLEVSTLAGHSFEVELLTLSGDGRVLASADHMRHVLIWDWENSQIIGHQYFPEKDIKDIRLSQSGKYLALVYRKSSDLLDPIYHIEVYDIKDFSIIFKKKLKIEREPVIRFTGDALLWSDQQNVFSTTFPEKTEKIWGAPEAFYAPITTSSGPNGQLVIVDEKKIILFKNGREAGSFDNQFYIKHFSVSSDGAYAALAQADHSLVPLPIFRVAILDLHNWEIVKEFPAHRASIRQLTFLPGNEWLLSSAEDGTVAFWDWRQGEKKVSFNADNEGFVAFQPNRYFFSSKDINQLIGFETPKRVYPFEQFDLQYHRPDLILQTLGMAPDSTIETYRKLYQKRRINLSDRLQANVDLTKLPTVSIVSSGWYAERKDSVIQVEILAQDARYPLSELHVFINRVPVYGPEGISLNNQKSKTVRRKIELLLGKGENKIEVSVKNSEGIESLRESFNVQYDGKPGKPDLYIIAVGVSAYENSEKNLAYAAKDASELLRTFQQQKDHYAKIHYLPVLNESFNRSKLPEMKVWLNGTKVDDKVVLFYAGHGLIDSSFNYYLSTYQTDFSNPQLASVPYTEMESVLAQIPARQKIFMIDACHSGEIDKQAVRTFKLSQTAVTKDIRFRGEDTNMIQPGYGIQPDLELMKNVFIDLRRGTGATVISSAGGFSFAIEGDQWESGVFSYALLQGLQQMSADRNRDGQINVGELKQYLAAEVPRLTQNLQQPTSRINELANDFVIWYGKTPQQTALQSSLEKGTTDAAWQLLDHIALIFNRDQNYQEVIELAGTALNKWPAMADFNSYRAMAYQNLNQHENALKDFNQVLKVFPNNHNTFLLRAISHSALGHHESAQTDCRLFLDVEPENVLGTAILGEVYIHAGKLDLAREMIEKVKNIAPDNPLINDLESSLSEQQEAQRSGKKRR